MGSRLNVKKGRSKYFTRQPPISQSITIIPRNLFAEKSNGSVKPVTGKFFLNNEKHEKTRKNFMEAALTANMRRTSHEIFSGR